MPAFTSFLNLYKPGGGSTGLILPDEVVDIDRLNQNFELIDDFAEGWGNAASRNHNLYGPAASLSGVAGMKRGDTYQESDAGFNLWEYDGTNWVFGANGLYRVRPTSVTGHANATIEPGGFVKLAAVPASSTIDLLGIFSPRYKNYRLQPVFTAKPSVAFGAGATVQGLVGTTPVAGASYSFARQGYVGGARTDFQGTNQANFGEGLIIPQGTLGSSVIDIMSPNAAEPTFLHAQHLGVGGITADLSHSAALNDGPSFSQLTGLRLTLAATAPWTGEIRIYGMI